MLKLISTPSFTPQYASIHSLKARYEAVAMRLVTERLVTVTRLVMHYEPYSSNEARNEPRTVCSARKQAEVGRDRFGLGVSVIRRTHTTATLAGRKPSGDQ